METGSQTFTGLPCLVAGEYTQSRTIFVAAAWFLPDIMLAAADISPWAAGAVVVVFLLGFFALLWIRSRTKRD